MAVLCAVRVLTGKRFAIDRVAVPTRDGGETERELVVHPGSAVVLPWRDDGRVVLIRNERFSVGRALWELPAGTLEPGEDPAACAARELEEEAGYRAAKVEPLVAFYASPGICTEKMHAFLATGLTHVGQALEPTERIEAEAVPLARALEMAREGTIEDGKTLAALLYFHAFRAEARGG